MIAAAIPLRNQFGDLVDWAIVDAAHFGSLSERRWHRSAAGYATCGSRGKAASAIYLHREVMKLAGIAILGLQVDHKNGKKLDNTPENLRPAHGWQNQANRKIPKNNTSGMQGVSRLRGSWRARICIHGKEKHLGLYATKELAFAAYCDAAKQYKGEFAAVRP